MFMILMNFTQLMANDKRKAQKKSCLTKAIFFTMDQKSGVKFL